ncbi:hypothetical protein HD597_003370 [Nonomuraea thailandensis]|uniref:Uncharacterized protein n=1 Tax=Nonomuraea thailandensis TaxID=1188745 RepID=A0A9X2K1T8_9ACTN|nr:DUF6182 family protein [Nonomuraea thailandensis]MCP2356350.1 hypothetical protein [Nonomuraea thailandensis]
MTPSAPPDAPDQRTLRAHLEARLARVRDARPTGPRTTRDVGVIAVLRAFDPATFAADAYRFAATLPDARGRPWYAAFTRTIFLAGDPRNLADRHPFDHLSPDGSIAWYAPAPLSSREGLRRLLRPFRGLRGLTAPLTEEVPLGNGNTTARLDVPVAGLPLEDYLVHVNHLIAEAALDGLLPGTGRLLLRHLPAAPPPAAHYTRIRVVPDPGSPARLRACAYLTL